jgi:hypothetical protein
MATLQKTKPATTASESLAAKRAAKAASAAPSTDMLARITTAAHALLELKAQEIALETQLAELKKQIMEMEFNTLTSLMDEAGVPMLALDEGQQLVRGEEVYASISKANAAAAAAWLIAHGYGAIVRTKVLVELEKEDTELLDLTRSALDKAHIGYEESSAVNAATLRAFVKERLEAGTELPDSISVHVQPRVTVKEIKKRVNKRVGV